MIKSYKDIDEFDNEIIKSKNAYKKHSRDDNAKKENFDKRNELLRKMSLYFYVMEF